MAYDKLVDSTQLDNNLTSVANAIRTKGGTSGQLAFPNGFVSAVQNIPTGTTPTGTKNISITENGVRTEDVTNYASAKITTNVPTPTGTKQVNIITNGTVTEDVTNYASAEITTAVPQMQRSILRPDAVKVETWSYDKLWIEDEGETLPAYSTTALTLKASEPLEITHEFDLDNYKYFVLERGLAIPIYNTDDIARGRPEWSLSSCAYEFVYPERGAFHALVDPTKSYGSIALSWVVSGGAVYRMPYFTNGAGALSVYAATSYGLWVSMAAPSWTSGAVQINSPSLTLRCQPNVFDQPFYESLNDIRFQWITELWREPIGSLDYNGWAANQELDKILECVYSTDHKLT